MVINKNLGKKVVQDIVPGERRATRSVPIKRIIKEENEEEEIDNTEVIKPIQRKKITPVRNSGSYKYLIIFIITIISLGIIGVALSLSYSKAIVTITPKIVNINVGGTFTAKKNVTQSIEDTSELAYDVISVSNSASQTVSAVSGPLIQTKAKGTVFIYNNYSTTSQTLVAGTRIANSDGLIYRTATTVSVPPKKTVPGVISVVVVADKAGGNYNISIADNKTILKIIGYKGTPKYDGFVVKLKTNISGGYSGSKMVINDNSKKAAIKAMQDSLKEQLVTKLNQNVPKDSILYNSAYNIEYETPEPIMKTSNEAEIIVKGSAYGATFKTEALIKFVAGNEMQKFPSDTYIIEGEKGLEFKISNIKDFSIKKGTPLIFTLKGPIKVTGIFSESSLKNDRIGVKASNSNAIFAEYPSITSAQALITPFWMRTFPNSADQITIDYKY